jgi:3-methyladenine DNA glycosylase AlkD
MAELTKLKKDLKNKSSKKRSEVLQRFFKTGIGEYGYGDIFIGVTVPDTRKIAKKYFYISFKDIKKLLNSKIHEERLLALIILVYQFEHSGGLKKKMVYNFYLENTKYVNNWDLVDLSADKIIGAYLSNKPKTVLKSLAKSENLWERRIAIISTFNFIKNNKFNDTLSVAKILLKDEQDLIHKAVGWMLREVGKRNIEIEEKFLKKHYNDMPRTMLRYAIERFPENKRQKYLKGLI